MAGIATITPQVVDPRTGRVTRRARVTVPTRYSPPNRMPIDQRKLRKVGPPAAPTNP
jgi:hypothetical protein